MGASVEVVSVQVVRSCRHSYCMILHPSFFQWRM